MRSALLPLTLVSLMILSPWALAQPNAPDAGVPETDGPVHALLQDGNTVYVGGTFSTIGGVPRNCLAAFDALTGVVDPTWDPNISGGFPTRVHSLVIEGSRIHAGGIFTTVNGSVGRNNLAAFELAGGGNTGQVDANWNPSLTGGLGVVFTLRSSGGLIYTAGSFSTVNGSTTRNHLAAFPPADGVSTGTAAAWDPDVTGNGVMDIDIDGGIVYVGGLFTSVNGGAVARSNLAAVDASTGVADASWNPDVDSQVTGVLVHGSRVYIGGVFSNVHSLALPHLAAIELANGSNTGFPDVVWEPSPSSGGGSVNIRGLMVQDSKLYVGGMFSSVNGGTVTRHGAAAFNLSDGSSPAVAEAWDPNVTDGSSGAPSGYAFVATLLPSGPTGLLMGGDFTRVGGVEHNHLVGFSSTVPVELSVMSAD